MHRIPLQLPIPTISWKRRLPECVLFETTLNQENFNETKAFMNVLDEEAEFYKMQCYGIADHKLRKAESLISVTDPVSMSASIYLATYIILRTPSDSAALSSALKIRGDYYYYHIGILENASNDYEMYMHINNMHANPAEDLCEITGNLTVCKYMMGQHYNAKKYWLLYNKYKAKLSSEILEKDNFVHIEKLIDNFLSELNDPSYVLNKPITNTNDKTFVDMPLKCCDSYSGEKAGLYSNCLIPKAAILFAEKPLQDSMHAPLMRCEVCYRQSSVQIYTCLKCRYKTYCSLKCMEDDKDMHAHECIGFKQLTLLLLDATATFRVFVKILQYFHDHVFCENSFRKCKTALDVWYNVLEIMNKTTSEKCSILSLVAKRPAYEHLSTNQYSTMVTKSLRLTIFIDTKTQLIEAYLRRLQISSKQKLIIVGSLLMRVHTNLLLNTFDVEVNNDTDLKFLEKDAEMVSLITSSIPKNKPFIEDLNQYYKVNTKRDVWQRSVAILRSASSNNAITLETLPRNKHAQSCSGINRILSIYKDNITKLLLNPDLIESVVYGPNANQPIDAYEAATLCKHLADMNDMQRCVFVKKFARLFHTHYDEYFIQMLECNQNIPQILSLYSPTLKQFKHSCDPNVEIIILENGVIVGKALREIKCGKQLYVAYKANHMRHTRKDRETFLKRIGVKCQCKYCKIGSPNEHDLRHVIYCEVCEGVKITPELGQCPNCGIQYKNLLTKYRTVINILENDLDKQLMPQNANQVSDRSLYISHLITYMHAKDFFGSHNEYRISIELKHARYLAMKNFAPQAYQLIMELHRNISQCYEEHYIWFTYYADILLTIKIVINFNIDARNYPISSHILLELCDLGIYITKGQVETLKFYESFDGKCGLVIEDLTTFLQWKEKVDCNEVVPLAGSLKQDTQQSKWFCGKKQNAA